MNGHRGEQGGERGWLWQRHSTGKAEKPKMFCALSKHQETGKGARKGEDSSLHLSSGLYQYRLGASGRKEGRAWLLRLTLAAILNAA